MLNRFSVTLTPNKKQIQYGLERFICYLGVSKLFKVMRLAFNRPCYRDDSFYNNYKKRNRCCKKEGG
jgi:hypothetical protein